MNSSIVLNNRKSQAARKIVHKSRVRLPRDFRSGDNNNNNNTSSFYVQSLIHNYSNFKSSDCVARLMYRQGDDWVDYEESVVEFVRDCWNPMVEVQIGGVLCIFDFYRMLVSDFETQFEKSVAWIDVNGKCFFPKFVVGGDNEFSSFREGLGKVEIEVRVSGGELLNKRKREGDDEVKSVGSCSNVNEFKKKKREVEKGEVVCEEMESRRWMKAKVMGEGGMATTVVRNLFLKWGGIKGIGAEITGIHQVTRTSLVDKARYEAFLNQVETTKAARGEANVTFAWVKCSTDDVQRILNYGFSIPLRGCFGKPFSVTLGEAFGIGIYLSPVKSARASVVHHEAGENHVILCRVILGKCEKVQSGSQQLYPSSVEYDTGVDDVSNPKWYVVWGANMNTHILPECVVSYKHTRYHSGLLSAIPRLGLLPATPRLGQSSLKSKLTWMPKVSNVTTAKFFENLLRSLPSSKVPELRTLCCTYKAGKVPKSIFMKKLRSVVGDQMLRTAIEEVRG